VNGREAVKPEGALIVLKGEKLKPKIKSLLEVYISVHCRLKLHNRFPNSYDLSFYLRMKVDVTHLVKNMVFYHYF
jgi:hypothetical protein